MEEMITLTDLTKRFGPITAVEDVSLSVASGEVLGFLGPNGAGKSTTMRMITGFLAPTMGRAVVCGTDVVDDPIAAQRRIGYLPEGAPLYGDMTPAALLDFVAEIRGLRGAEKERRIAAAVDKMEIASVLERPIDTLSKGFKRRVGLAQAILHDPDILILDEPTDGLDPNQKIQVRAMIRDLGRDKAIIISTHILEEVDAVCTRAVVIAAGRLVFDGSPRELRVRSDYHNAVSIRLKADAAAAARSGLEGLAGVARVESGEADDGAATLIVIPEAGGTILDQVNHRLHESRIDADELHVMAGRLDEVFHELTTASGPEDRA